jgi:hypothetical protein
MLSKYTVDFYRCPECGLIFTQPPHWLDEAYGEAINDLDLGYVGRNILCRDKLVGLLQRTPAIDSDGRFLDYGGGYGMFTRMMRDAGYDFYLTDKFCDNIFAKYFQADELPGGTRFEMVTCYEVFEHLQDPVAEMEKLLAYSRNIYFSTVLQPAGQSLGSTDDWWYFVPETGQHIMFYTERSLAALAARFSLNYYTDGAELHLFTDKTLPADYLRPVRVRLPPHVKLARRIAGKKAWTITPKATPPRPSLIPADLETVRAKLVTSQTK